MQINSVTPRSLDDAQLVRASEYLKTTAQYFPPLKIARVTSDLGAIDALALQLRTNFEDIVILGTGGSNLGAKTLCAIRKGCSPRLHFMDNVDPHTFNILFEEVNPETTAILAISKSGKTAETLTQLLTCLERWKALLGESKLKDHIFLITEPKDTPFRQLSSCYNLSCLDHPEDIGGRFSCLTLVGLLPAMIADLDAKKVRAGAASYLDQCLSDPTAPPVLGAVFAASNQSSPIHVLMPYVDRLADFGMWYRQLWAESLGKLGKGFTPVRAMGTVDQHSQLQLYLDGPKDKSFTVITLQTQNQGDILKGTGVDYLENHTMGDLLAAEAKATIDTLRNNGCHVRTIDFQELNEDALGSLFMHYMIETILTAHLMNIDAFNQPAVEQGKILTREYLAA